MNFSETDHIFVCEFYFGVVHHLSHIFLFRRKFGFSVFAFWKIVPIFAKQNWGFVVAFVGMEFVRSPFGQKTAKTMRYVAFSREYGGIQKTRF
jgi:hypothetical protein